MILPSSHSVFIKRPYRSQSKPSSLNNIFEEQEASHHTPIKKGEPALPSIYHFVGPATVRDQIMKEKHAQPEGKQHTLQQMEERQKAGEMGNSIVSTNGNQSMSKFSTRQLKQLTKQYRNMQFFKQYQSRWEKQVNRIKKQIQNVRQPTLLERQKKNLVVQSNPEKDQILKNYVTSYWEMSLRNNNKILKQHLKGNTRYEESQLERLLQSGQGIKQVERSVPKLPVQQLNKLADRELVLSGRNKLASQTMSCDPSVISNFSSRRSRAISELPPVSHPEMYRIAYDSAHRYAIDAVQ